MSSRLVQLHVLIIVILCKFETLQHEKRYLKINTAYVHISRNIPYLKYKIRSRFSCESIPLPMTHYQQQEGQNPLTGQRAPPISGGT